MSLKSIEKKFTSYIDTKLKQCHVQSKIPQLTILQTDFYLRKFLKKLSKYFGQKIPTTYIDLKIIIDSKILFCKYDHRQHEYSSRLAAKHMNQFQRPSRTIENIAL
jgi:hypothetical protein